MPRKLINYILIFCLVILMLPAQKASADTFHEGVNAYNAGNYSYAEACFRNALQANPGNDFVKYYLAISLVQNKKFSDAKMLYRNIIATSSDSQVVNLSKNGLKLLGAASTSSSSGGRSYSSGGVSKAVISLSSVGNALVVSNVNVNDSARVSFVVDTGASITTISSDLASRLGINTSGAQMLKIMTGSGYVNAPKVTLSKIEVNGLAAYNVEAVVTDLPIHTSGSAGDLAGLLGLSFMKHFKVTVDNRHNQLILER